MTDRFTACFRVSTGVVFTLAAMIAPEASAGTEEWKNASQAIPSQVTTSNNEGKGYSLQGEEIAYDFGDVSNGDPGNMGDGGSSIEFIFNLKNSGSSIRLGQIQAWRNEETTSFKLEQWPDTQVFGATTSGRDFTFKAKSTFDVDTHVVFVTHKDNKLELFLNGVSVGNSSRKGDWVNNGGKGFIGGSGPDAAIGTIHGVASYSSALTPEEIRALYTAFAGQERSSTVSLQGSKLDLVLRRSE